MKKKIKYIFIGFIMGFMVYACEESSLYADYDEDGMAIRGSVEWLPLYVYIVND